MIGVNVYKCIILIWLVTKVLSQDGETKYTFRCKNGIFMQDDAFCSGFPGEPCGDGTDEELGCNRNMCGEGPNYWCDDVCHEGLSIRCNTKADCADGSDEYDCGDEIDVHNCSLRTGRFLCDDHLRCLDVRYMCNGFCQCFDCSDEKHNCPSDQEMEEFENENDSQACFKTPKGPQCSTALDYDDIFQRCTDDQQKQCEQKCVRLGEQSKCLCDENYISVKYAKNKKCISNEKANNTLYVATKEAIGQIDLDTKTFRVIQNDTAATALTSAHDYIYYSTYDQDNSSGNIFKKLIISDDEANKIIHTDSNITSLAIDWITNKIYYSTNSSIFACAEDDDGYLEGDFEDERTMCHAIKSCHAVSIGLAPRFGLMFWVEIKEDDRSAQYIMKSAMDGSDEILLTVREKVPWELKIAIDELTERVYFWSGRVGLTFISFDGQYQSEFQPKTYQSSLSSVFTVFERKIYFSTYKSAYISVGDISSRLFSVPFLLSHPMSSAVNHLYGCNPILQRTKVSNKCAESCTGGICLLRPSASRNKLDHTCFYNGTNMRHLPIPKIPTTPFTMSSTDPYLPSSLFPIRLSVDDDSYSSPDDLQSNFTSTNPPSDIPDPYSSTSLLPATGLSSSNDFSSSSDDSQLNYVSINPSSNTPGYYSSTSSFPATILGPNNDSSPSPDDFQSTSMSVNPSSDASNYSSTSSRFPSPSPDYDSTSNSEDSQFNFSSRNPSFYTSDEYSRTSPLPQINLNSSLGSNSSSDESLPDSNLDLTSVTQSNFVSHSTSSFVSNSELVLRYDPGCDSKHLVLIILSNGIFTVCITIVVIILFIRNLPTLLKNIQPKEMSILLQSMRENKQALIDTNDPAETNV